MKRIATTLLMATLILSASAQGMIIDKTQSRSTKKGKADTLIVDQLAYRITYKTKTVNDTTKNPYKYRDDDMRLDIGKNGVSRFYSYSMAIRNQMLAGI